MASIATVRPTGEPPLSKPTIEILPPADEETLILASGPWFNEAGSQTRRVVLRLVKDGTEYVVHTQCRQGYGPGHFDQGNYFALRNDPDNALSKAFASFVSRNLRLMGMDANHVAQRLDDSVIQTAYDDRFITDEETDADD